ncbi:MAG: dTDP-4-dehydrorhamnose 3,5-epimerase family protein [Planctomycetota bacterium]|jgi:dTDP-4-dehydrorhamnose 3,5-epimerase
MRIKTKHFENRGSAYTIYERREFDIDFVQDKISKSYQGVIRGFHGDNQTWKLITCLYGRIKFVTYDIDNDRKETYILDGDSKESVSILVPPRVLNAHQCLSSHCIFHYKWSHYYSGPENQWSVFYNDADIDPQWSCGIGHIVSDRDTNSGSLKVLKEKLHV